VCGVVVGVVFQVPSIVSIWVFEARGEDDFSTTVGPLRPKFHLFLYGEYGKGFYEPGRRVV
jgi:hypothetical protein